MPDVFKKSELRRRGIAISVIVVVALIHVFRAGSYLSGNARRLYYGYGSDLLLPFVMYFVLVLAERNLKLRADWKAKAAIVFAAASIAELLQGIGVPALGSTFDPLDFVMYASGVLAAALVDMVFRPR